MRRLDSTVDDYYAYKDDDYIEAETTRNEESASEYRVTVIILSFSLLIAAVLVLSKALHNRPRLSAVLSESSMVLIFGMVVGLLFRLFYGSALDEAETVSHLLSFPSKVFFLGLLPPIMFNSGYELQRELFFRHFRAIVSFAVVGTMVSAVSTGFLLYCIRDLGWFGDAFVPTLFELLTFGALIAATDCVSVLGVLKSKRVDPHLFNLVFGESSLNDAVALVLFKSLSNVLIQDAKHGYILSHEMEVFLLEFTAISLGSPVLGIGCSVVGAILFKKMDMREHKIVELCLYILLMYIPYMFAEALFFSGIVTIFFSGMSARRYIEPNLSPETAHHAEAIFKALSFLAETAIFLELGLSCFGQLKFSGFNWQFACCAFVASLLGRALSIYPVSFIYNHCLKRRTDPEVDYEDDSSVNSLSESSASSLSSSGRYITPESKRDMEIPTKFMHFLWFAGLRGAVAYACARSFPNVYGNKDEIVTTTMSIILVSIIVMGGFSEVLLEHWNIRMNVNEKQYMKLWRRQRRGRGAFHRFENEYIYKLVVRETSDVPVDGPEVKAGYERKILEFGSIAINKHEANPDDYVLATDS